MNTRRPLFKDVRVRHALALAFDFEWANENLFYGAYTRTNSYFSNSELASSGIPEGDELALLNKYRDQLPPELFTKPFELPVTDGSGNNREQLRARAGAAGAGRLEGEGPQAGRRRTASRSASRSCWMSRRSSASPCRMCSGWRGWGSTRTCARSIRRSFSG